MRAPWILSCFIAAVACGFGRLEGLSAGGGTGDTNDASGADGGGVSGVSGNGGADAALGGGAGSAVVQTGGVGGAGGGANVGGEFNAGSEPYATFTAKHSGKCLDVRGGVVGGDPALRQFACDESIYQLFRVVPVTADLYELRNDADPQAPHCIDVQGKSLAQGANIIANPCDESSENQRWRLQQAGVSTFELPNRFSGFCLSVAPGDRSDGAQIVQLACTKAGSQIWEISPVEPAGSGGAVGSPGLSVGKPSEADSQELAKGNVATSGNDGNVFTRWCAADGELNHWWSVDLGSSHELTRIQINWEQAQKVYRYKIESSDNRLDWTMLVDATTSTEPTRDQTHRLDNARGQYVKITITGLDSGAWACFWELTVFGTP